MDKSIILAIIACSGFWSCIQLLISNWITKKQKAEDKATITKEEHDLLKRALLGILYGELEKRCTAIIQDGEVSVDMLHETKRYYYDVYIELGGNGVISKLWHDIEQLPIKK